jgi:excisionase family DNA binding protein
MENTDETGSDTWLTVEEAAVLLQRKPRAVHSYAEAGRLTVRRVGRRNLFARTEVDALSAELHAADVLADRLAAAPDAPMSDTLTPQIAALQGEFAALRKGMVHWATTQYATQQHTDMQLREELARQGARIAALHEELARQGKWPGMRDIAADYVRVSAERDMLREELDGRRRWWDLAGASLMIVGGQILLVIVLIALGVIQRG